ncbi:unnamed protein product [Ceutorhynchus assimilis]|uniref:Uncharacterized protein n=1 Tax=Ceutorhynchus assimilis TaxID=467358 RepID=A0A9N9MI06_9CUCU|nr:unnamed protein product [Ceutorhynchus assimilis]
MWNPNSFASVLSFLLNIWFINAARPTCGGTYTALHGVLTTPSFPGPFEVPIKCQWVIDASNVVSANTSIIVYFTQLFTFEGLTFTEYQIYGSDYKINPKIIHQVNETNIIRTRWIQTYQSYLVIELKMQSADSAHIRVLDRFLDTYGFNLTYEITTSGVRTPTCTMMDCGFTGVCYDNFKKFKCICFEGYSGSNCSEGPKSFCYTNGTPTCKNGGTCLHVGVAAVKCHCSKLFTGNTCETPSEPANRAKDCSNCSKNCSYVGKEENACRCLNAKLDGFGKPGFFVTLHLGNLPVLDPNDLKAFIRSYLLEHLRENFSEIEDLDIVGLIHYMSGADVTFQVFGPKKEEKKVKNAINKWADRGYVGNITVAEKDNSIKTPLSIQSVDINQPGVIRENDEFILSCVARGSPSITFRWFKYETFVNLTYTRHKWVKLIKDPHVSDQYTALLAVERAQKYDEGKFTCQVEDFNIQQCMSKFVKVKTGPLVKIEPMSLTVKKGQNFTVKCVTLEDNGGIGGKYTYSWTKNKELLPVKTNHEKYETLYPAGTILQISGIDKDSQYSCLVQDSTSSSERSIQVYVLDRKGIHTCSQETNYGLVWPETAPDTDFIQECPKYFSGIVSRTCRLSDGKTPTWRVPNFSQCTSKVLQEVYHQFQQIKLGYVATSFEKLFSGILNYLSSVELHPGEGERVLHLVQEMLTFIGQTKTESHAIQNLSRTIFPVLDIILSSPNALIKSKEINLLQKIFFEQLKLSGFYLSKQPGFTAFNLSLNSSDLTVLKATQGQTIFHIPAAGKKLGVQTWITSKLTYQRSEPINSDMFIGIIYRNLSSFFPSKLFLRIRDGTEIQYQIFSQIMTFASVARNQSENNEATVTVDFQHRFSTDALNVSQNERWEVRCGYSDFGWIAYSWDIYACNPEYIDDRSTTCVCPKYGSYVLMLVRTNPEETIAFNEPQKYVLICSFFLCIILTLFTTICLGASCFLTKYSCIIILKLQCSISIFLCEVLFAMAILIEPPQKYMMVYLTFLEMFLLLAISSHLSKLLIVFTELIEVPRTISLKYTVMGIISGVPLLTIFGTHLAYKTMDLNLKSWWMSENSLAFNIFLAVLSVVTGLFIFIYFLLTKKLKELLVSQEKNEIAVKMRIALIQRAGCLFFFLLIFAFSSIVYINGQKLLWNIYQFGAANAVLGVVLTLCYILKAETEFRKLFRKRPEKQEASFFNLDSTGPLQFMTKHPGESDNQSDQHRKEIQQISLKSFEATKATISKTQSISNAFESCLQSSSSFCDISVKETSSFRKDKNLPVQESYNNSPPTNRPINCSSVFSQSPDILTTKTCVGLDLVASSMCVTLSKIESSGEPSPLKSFLKKDKRPTEPKTVRIMFPPQVIITTDDNISKTTEVENDSMQTERTQPDGHTDISTNLEMCTDVQQETSPVSNGHHVTFKEDNLDGVLNSISQDLDYLLNRSNESESAMGTTTLARKPPKPPSAGSLNTVPEHLIKSCENSTCTDNLILRTNC